MPILSDGQPSGCGVCLFCCHYCQGCIIIASRTCTLSRAMNALHVSKIRPISAPSLPVIAKTFINLFPKRSNTCSGGGRGVGNLSSSCHRCNYSLTTPEPCRWFSFDQRSNEIDFVLNPGGTWELTSCGTALSSDTPQVENVP